MMADLASVASDAAKDDAAMSSSERFNTRKYAAHQHNPKGVEFASNILNDMGPPPVLCSALLLAANAACRPSSRCSLRSFDTHIDGEAPSDVVAHLDTVSYLLLSIVLINSIKLYPLPSH